MNDIEIEAGLAATDGYRYADMVGDRLHVAGQVPLDADGVLVGPGDVAAQARQCLANLHTLVAVHGFALGDVHHITVHVVGVHQDLLDAWRAVTDWFGSATAGAGVPPATLLGANLLGHGGQLVEIDARVERAGGRDAHE